jgi:hypothetical protein
VLAGFILWQFGGSLQLPPGEVRLVLNDLTGLCGRFDAKFLSIRLEEARQTWPYKPVDVGPFDVVVVSGSMVRSVASLAAAHLGERVAFAHNRHYLDGNGSMDVDLSPSRFDRTADR